MAKTMFKVKKGSQILFASTLGTARAFRKQIPELKGGRITNVLQMLPSQVAYGVLYTETKH